LPWKEFDAFVLGVNAMGVFWTYGNARSGPNGLPPFGPDFSLAVRLKAITRINVPQAFRCLARRTGGIDKMMQFEIRAARVGLLDHSGAFRDAAAVLGAAYVPERN
jgi:hypothetical protein